MTTTVRGAGRTQYAASRRHQQRTPLPPRGTIVTTEEYAERTAELQEAAMGKNKKQKAAAAGEAAPTAEPRSAKKAREFILDAEKWGWVVTKKEGVNGVASVTVMRGDEAIFIAWQDGRCLNSTTHTVGANTVKLRNASAARGAMLVPPGKVRRDVRKRVAACGNGVSAAPAKGVLPFDIDSTPDDEVLAALLGRQIVWQNALTGGTERARLEQTRFVKIQVKYREGGVEKTRIEEEQANNKHTKIETTTAGRRVFTWAAPEGFRSVALDQILQVR
jgi:hypothetical protein